MLPEKVHVTADNKEGEFNKQFTRTYKLSGENIHGFTDEREALEQAIKKILNTERFYYPVYTSDYGVELDDLFGRDIDYACVELERRIREALTADSRIEDVFGFDFSVSRNTIHVTFVVRTIAGNISGEVKFDV